MRIILSFLGVLTVAGIFLSAGCVEKILQGPPEDLVDSPGLAKAGFIFHDGEGPDAGGEFSRELGVNTIPVYLDDWSGMEPEDDLWNWDKEFPNKTGEYDHVILRIGILHMLAWNPDAIPDWVDKNDLDGRFREEYGGFVREAVSQVKARRIPVDVYLVELESNFAGHELGKDVTNAWIIDWIKWETDLIRSVDPDATIVVPLTPTEFRPDESLDNTGDYGKILAADFVRRMTEVNVSFDAFGFNIASGFYDKVDDWTDVERVLDEWSDIDKEIFVWAMSYPADNSDNLDFNYPREGGYSEEWQKEQYVNTMRILLKNPKVIGVSIDLYDYQEAGFPTPVHWGLVGGNRSRPETLHKRQSFEAVKDYWRENYR